MDSAEEKEQFQLWRAYYIVGDQHVLKILSHLELYGERNFTQLRIELGISSATLTKKLALLQKARLVCSQHGKDRRQVVYQLDKHQKYVSRLLESLERLAKEL